MINISVPSSTHIVSNGDYSLDITDFDSYEIPKPKSIVANELAYKGGSDNDVILLFENEDSITEYSQSLNNAKLLKTSTASDLIKNQKIERIAKSLGLYFELNNLNQRINNKTFSVDNSSVHYKFQHGNTLTIMAYGFNQINYKISLRNDKFYLDTNKQIESEELEIIVGTDDIIRLEPEFTHRKTLYLREV